MITTSRRSANMMLWTSATSRSGSANDLGPMLQIGFNGPPWPCSALPLLQPMHVTQAVYLVSGWNARWRLRRNAQLRARHMASTHNSSLSTSQQHLISFVSVVTPSELGIVCSRQVGNCCWASLLAARQALPDLCSQQHSAQCVGHVRRIVVSRQNVTTCSFPSVYCNITT